MPAPAMAHRVTFGVDIEGYSKRRDPEQVELQARLCWLTEQALKASGVKPRQCERQDQGDGQLISLPRVIDMKSVLPALPHAMQAAIHQVNRVPGPGGRIRMRMSVAQGPVQVASAGYVGPGVIAASRMLDSRLLRDTLRDNTRADLVLMVTDDLYQQVYRQGYSGLAATDFRDALLDNKAKNYVAHVWIYVPSGSPDTRLVPAFTGTDGDVTAMWDVAIPAAGIGAVMWQRHHDHHQGPHQHPEPPHPADHGAVGESHDAHAVDHPIVHDTGHDDLYPAGDDHNYPGHDPYHDAWHDHAHTLDPALANPAVTDPGLDDPSVTDPGAIDGSDPGGHGVW